MSRKSAAVAVFCCAVLSVVLVFSPATSHAVVNFGTVAPESDSYKDQVGSGATTAGDIWGGEQGSEPEIGPTGPSASPSMPLINTLPPGSKPEPHPVPSGGAASWLYQFGGMLEWVLSSLRLISA